MLFDILKGIRKTAPLVVINNKRGMDFSGVCFAILQTEGVSLWRNKLFQDRLC